MEGKELGNYYTVQSQIISSLNQSRENWFSLLKESLDNEELRNDFFEKITEIDNRIASMQRVEPEFMYNKFIDIMDKRLEALKKEIKK